MPTPKPFCFNKSQVKAFVLGADPTNESDGGKPVELTFAFGIGQDARYFQAILKNLNNVGLHLEDLYIQNLLPEIQVKETSKNINFEKDAAARAKVIAAEFNKIDPQKRIPVFLTAEKVYHAVMIDTRHLLAVDSYYKGAASIPIAPEANRLGRPVIPLFRHKKYDLGNYPDYINRIRDVLTKSRK